MQCVKQTSGVPTVVAKPLASSTAEHHHLCMQNNITEPDNTPSPKAAPPETAFSKTTTPYHSTPIQYSPPLTPQNSTSTTPCQLLASTTAASSRARLLCIHSQADSFNNVEGISKHQQRLDWCMVTLPAFQHWSTSLPACDCTALQ